MARTRTSTTSRRPRKQAASASAATQTAVRTTGSTTAASTTTPAASANGFQVADLAGGLRGFLGTIEKEVRAVSALSEQIDDLVERLNAARTEQAERLLALDALQGSAKDGGLTSFLDKLIRPRMPRVAEVVPDRLA